MLKDNVLILSRQGFKLTRHDADMKLISDGLCPKGCGWMMLIKSDGQQCPMCGFVTNILPRQK